MKFSSIIGHERNKDYFRKIQSSGRVPHAMLFSGPEGLGKTMCAVGLAAVLNCENPAEDGACGTCPSCFKLKTGNHPFINFVGSTRLISSLEVAFPDGVNISITNMPGEHDGTSSVTKKINIYQIRRLIRESSLKVFSGEKKVFIIKDISQTSTEALNSLLKILEEPPPDTVFILITSKEELLLPTIISRCHKVKFTPLSRQEMLEFSKNIDNVSSDKSMETLLEISSGIPGKLKKLSEAESTEFNPAAMENFFEEARNWFKDNEDCIEKLNIMLEYSARVFRENPGEANYMNIRHIEKSLESIRRNVNTELVVSDMFIKMGYLGNI